MRRLALALSVWIVPLGALHAQMPPPAEPATDPVTTASDPTAAAPAIEAPAPELEAPAPEAVAPEAVAQVPEAVEPAPATDTVEPPSAADAKGDGLKNFEAECWRVSFPVEGRPPLVDESEFEAHLMQKGFGSLTRRAVFNADGRDDRLLETAEKQSDMLMRLRMRHQIGPAIAAGVLLASTPVVLVTGALAAAFFFFGAGINVPFLAQGSLANGFVTYGAFIASVLAVPAATAMASAAIVPVTMAILRTVQLGGVPDSFLLDGNGFSLDEAQTLARDHNALISHRLGLTSTPACHGR